ncbi:small integral membrane protein 4 [Leptopilina boulardi]|uniref:small integral membrane protein 4 n=1 Tax=Leptopilina boulardi TaxID=63433 RepID=UPI0021F67009|nr:small integral membrane protein 4 [Leptopilina boulardi]
MIRKIARFIQKVPGEKYLAEYRFIPLFFILGAVLEYSMINWHVGETNFYRTFKKRRVQEIVDERILKESKNLN